MALAGPDEALHGPALGRRHGVGPSNPDLPGDPPQPAFFLDHAPQEVGRGGRMAAVEVGMEGGIQRKQGVPLFEEPQLPRPKLGFAEAPRLDVLDVAQVAEHLTASGGGGQWC